MQQPEVDALSKLEVVKNLLDRSFMAFFIHSSRARFFSFLDKFCNFLTIILGAAAVSDLAKLFDVSQSITENFPKFVAAFLTIIGTLQLVFSLTEYSKRHETARKELLILISEIESKEKTQKNVERWNERLIRITAEAPSVGSTTEKLAYNKALRVLGHESSGFVDIPVASLLVRGRWPWSYRKQFPTIAA